MHLLLKKTNLEEALGTKSTGNSGLDSISYPMRKS